jgi:hypothetical protein
MIKVVCITDDPYYSDVLTCGKIYDARVKDEMVVRIGADTSSTGFYYTIKNDLGLEAEYYYGHFTTLDKWRNSKINEVLQ